MTPRRRAALGRGDVLDLFGPAPESAPEAPCAAPSRRREPEPPRAIPGGEMAGAYDGRRAATSSRSVAASLAPSLDVSIDALDDGLGGSAVAGMLPGAFGETADSGYASGIPGAVPASAIAVSTLTQTAKEVVEGAFVPLWVRGEISDFKAHRNGHWYFCLRDESSLVRCVVWSRDARRLPAPPDEGMQVVAFGQPTVYASRGDLQLVVRALDAQGDGLWRKALERTRARLDADGLLDTARKRALPRFPRRVAIVTSLDGAVLHDVAVVLRRRCPSVELVVVPAKVQGDGAAAELRAAVETVGRWGGADVLIVGRGGGARDDLWAFNDEALARAIAASPIPTISAVGHEVDVTICDLVADVRAATPSVAAETAVPMLDDLRADVDGLGQALAAALVQRAARARRSLDDAAHELAVAGGRAVERRRATIGALAGQLQALSPLATLGRGYAVARDGDGRTLSRVADFAPDAPFDLLISDGRVRATTVGAELSEAS